MEDRTQVSTQADGEMVKVSLCILWFRAVALESLSKSLGTNSSSQSELSEEMSGTAEECGTGAEMWGLVTCGNVHPAQELGYFSPRQWGAMRGFGVRE